MICRLPMSASEVNRECCVHLPGSHLPSTQVQHKLRDEDCRGASQPIRAAQDAGRTTQDQQELPSRHHKGQAGSQGTGAGLGAGGRVSGRRGGVSGRKGWVSSRRGGVSGRKGGVSGRKDWGLWGRRGGISGRAEGMGLGAEGVGLDAEWEGLRAGRGGGVKVKLEGLWV